MARRICFISHSAYGYFSGGPAFGSRQFYHLSRYLADDYDVHFIVGDYGQPREERIDGVTLHKSYTPSPDTGVTDTARQLQRLWAAVGRADADVYFLEGRPRKLIVFSRLISAMGAESTYHVVSDELVEAGCCESSLLRLALYRRALSAVAAVITQTPYQRETLACLHGIDSTVIPSGYPPGDQIPPHESREYFLWVGRLEQELKRPHLFLDLAERVPDSEFMVAGPKEDDDYSDRLIRRIEAAENVTYVGSVSPDEIHQYYRNAIALVNTSALEGFPNTFLEAWRYATPVLGLDIDPNRFLTDRDESLCADGDVSTLATAADELAESVEARRATGRAGLRSFRKRYRLSAVAEQYEQLLETV